jgi:hypothetical protein
MQPVSRLIRRDIGFRDGGLLSTGGVDAEEVEGPTAAGDLKRKFSVIVDRRNKIVQEGDLQPTVPRLPWPIRRGDRRQLQR